MVSHGLGKSRLKFIIVRSKHTRDFAFARVGNVVRVRLLRTRCVAMRLRFARVVFARIVWFGNAEHVAHLFGMLGQTVCELRVGNVVRVRLLRARCVAMRLRFAHVVFARVVWFGNAELVAHLNL